MAKVCLIGHTGQEIYTESGRHNYMKLDFVQK